MPFDRNRLPDPLSFYEAEGLKLTGRDKWRTTSCVFHGGSDSMRIKVESGGWVCMACGERGGDVLAYAMLSRGIGFIEAARELGAWIDDGKPGRVPIRPPELSCRDRLEVLEREALVLVVVGSDMARNRQIDALDYERLMVAAARIGVVAWKRGE